MRVRQLLMTDDQSPLSATDDDACPGCLALVFWSETGEDSVLAAAQTLRAAHPDRVVIGCSTSGVVHGRSVLERAVAATLVSFERTRLATAAARLDEHGDIMSMARHLVTNLPLEGLRHVFVLSDGLAIDGCTLATGLTRFLPSGVTVTGGLAGDGNRYQRTLVLHGTEIFTGGAVCLGLYGEAIRLRQGTRDGWIPFGPERLITAAEGNMLLELDGESALDIFERYLGRHARNLPASAHLFPLNVRLPGASTRTVRTVLGLDANRRALIFGSSMPLGSSVCFMRGNIDSLLDGAEEAARLARPDGESLAVVISCVSRKMLLGQLVEEEIDVAAQVLGPQTTLTGFYSYGEIAQDEGGEGGCLYNQSMSITVLQEGP